MRTNKRTGILGGTFNPFHNGHSDIGLRVLEHFRLDTIRYILSARPPHKNEEIIASPDLRWKMLTEGLLPYPELIPDDIEVRRDDYSWTIDTIRQLKDIYPGDDFFFISGSEGFLKIRTWKDYRELLESISFIIVLRNSSQRREVTKLLKGEGITPVTSKKGEYAGPAIYYFSYESVYLSLSSTQIREMVGKGRVIDGLVNNKVKEIIEENDLYGKN